MFIDEANLYFSILTILLNFSQLWQREKFPQNKNRLQKRYFPFSLTTFIA